MENQVLCPVGNKLRRNLPPLPVRMKKMPIDERGYPVPRFVQYVTPDGQAAPFGCAPSVGKPDFRIMDGQFRELAARERLCWLCGEKLGTRFGFVAGPMCGINRISADGPSHRDCAVWAVIACPFLSNPDAVRNDFKTPENAKNPGGIMIGRNPGVSLIWLCRDFKRQAAPTPEDRKAWLFAMGEPFEVLFYREGRQATRAEIDAAIESGLPSLLAPAETLDIEDRQKYLEQLARQQTLFTSLLPEV